MPHDCKSIHTGRTYRKNNETQKNGRDNLANNYTAQQLIKNESPLLRHYHISTGCNRDQEPALVHAQVFFDKHLHWHLVIHITLPAEHNTPVQIEENKLFWLPKANAACVDCLCPAHSALQWSVWANGVLALLRYSPVQS